MTETENLGMEYWAVSAKTGLNRGLEHWSKFILGMNPHPDDFQHALFSEIQVAFTLTMGKIQYHSFVLLTGKTVLELFPVWVRIYSRINLGS